MAYVWVDGRMVPEGRASVPLMTHALHYGTSAFEGVRAYWDDGNLYVFRLRDHIRRLRRSGAHYNMTLRFTDLQICDAVLKLCRKNKMRRSCYIRPFYFVGRHGINLNVTRRTPTCAAIAVFPMGRLFEKGGIDVCVSPWRKFADSSTPTQAKMGGNYLNSISATIDAKKRGYDEALMLDLGGNVSEAPGENVFIVKDGRLSSPPAPPALKGITRDTITRIASDLGISTRIKNYTVRHMMNADEAFLSGTAAEITPIVRVDHTKIGRGRPGPITGRLMEEYARMVTGKSPKYARWLSTVY